MTQLPRKKSRNVENRSSHVAEWASKRQALIEAAKARREAVQLGEVTDEHTFSPQLRRRKGRSPESRYRSDFSQATMSSMSKASFSMSPRPSDASSPTIVSRNSCPSLERKDSAVQFNGVDEEMPSHSTLEGSGQSEMWAEDQSMEAFPATRVIEREDVAFPQRMHHGLSYSNFRCDRNSNSSSREELLNSESLFLQNSLRGSTDIEECYVDEFERNSLANSLKLPSLSSSATTEAPQRRSLSRDLEMEHGQSGLDFEESNASASSGSPHDNQELYYSSKQSMQRHRRSPLENRDLRSGSNGASAECMVATMESLRESPTIRPPRSRMDEYLFVSNDGQDRDSSGSGVQPPIPPIPPGMVGSWSWKDVGANATDMSRSIGSRPNRRQQPESSASRAQRQQEHVLDVMRIAESSVRNDGTILLQDLQRYSQGAHEEFLFWLAHCSSCVDSGVLHISDLNAAVGKFYLEGGIGIVDATPQIGTVYGDVNEAMAAATEPFASTAPPEMVCPPPLQSVASGTMESDGSVLVPWRDAPLRREEVSSNSSSPHSVHREILPHREMPVVMECSGQNFEELSRSHEAAVDVFHQPVTSQVLNKSSPRMSSLLQEPPIPQGEEKHKDRERTKRRRYFELKCLELEDQMEAAKKAEARLREELFALYQEDATCQRQDEQLGDAPHKATVGRAHERQWLGTVARPKSHNLISRSARDGRHQSSSTSPRRNCQPYTSLSPVKEEPHTEMWDSPPDSSTAPPAHRRTGVRTVDPAEADPVRDDPAEMQKLMEMCARLRKEDDSLPNDEIESLSDLVKQLAHLMERRREQAQESQRSNEDPEYAVPDFPPSPGQVKGSALLLGESDLSQANAPEHAGNECDSDSQFRADKFSGGEAESGTKPSAVARVTLQAMEKMVPKTTVRQSLARPVVLPPLGENGAALGCARFAHLTAQPDDETPLQIYSGARARGELTDRYEDHLQSVEIRNTAPVLR